MALAKVPVWPQMLYGTESKKPMAHAVLYIIILCCFYRPSSAPVLVWDPSTEYWEDFHIRYCGKVCVNGSLADLNPEVSECMWPRCFECDCHQTCSLLDTCCPHGTILPNGSFQRQENKMSRRNSLPPYPYQIQCASIPYNQWGNFLQVLNCPQDDYILSLDHKEEGKKNLKEMCVQNYTEETDLDYILPYVDVESGLVFRNKFCSLCNGYSVIFSDELSESNNVRTAVLWNLKVTCTHYQDVYHVTSYKEFVDEVQMSMICYVYYDKPAAKREPRTCFPPAQMHGGADACGEPFRSLCLMHNNTYLGLAGYKNIFCYMCAGLEPIHRLCNMKEDDYPGRGFSPGLQDGRVRIAPLSLLLGVTGSRTTPAYHPWINCTSKERWVDENVSARVFDHSYNFDKSIFQFSRRY